MARKLFGADPLSLLSAMDDDDGIGLSVADPRRGISRAMAPEARRDQLASIGLQAVLQVKAEQQANRDHRDAMLGLRPMFLVPCSSVFGTPIAASGALNINATPGVDCTIVKWVIGTVSAPWFDIFNVATGRSVLASGGAGAIPADAFDPDAVPVALDEPDISGGTPITVTGQNRDTINTHDFRSNFYCIDRNQKRFGSSRFT